MSDTAPDRPAGDFQLDPRLAADSVFVADGPLSQVRLMDDTRFPWLVLVPRVADVSEWIDLDGGQQRLLLAEINQLSQLLRAEPGWASSISARWATSCGSCMCIWSAATPAMPPGPGPSGAAAVRSALRPRRCSSMSRRGRNGYDRHLSFNQSPA